jgi:hypothetical protein
MYELTEEDKKYLSKVSRYMQSFGKKGLSITEYYDDEDLDDILNQFKNKIPYKNFFEQDRIDIPQGFKELVIKLIKNSKIKGEIDIYEINSSSIELVLTKNFIELNIYYHYTESNNEGTTYDGNYEEEVMNMINLLNTEEIRGGDIDLEVNYSGGGDSGYLENNFSNGNPVPKEFEDWCYGKLELNYGGWEIDSGSAGSFIVDFRNNEIVNSHDTYYEESKDINVFKYSF